MREFLDRMNRIHRIAEGDRFGLLLRLAFILSILFILSKCICIMTMGKRGKLPPEWPPIPDSLDLETERLMETASR